MKTNYGSKKKSETFVEKRFWMSADLGDLVFQEHQQQSCRQEMKTKCESMISTLLVIFVLAISASSSHAVSLPSTQNVPTGSYCGQESNSGRSLRVHVPSLRIIDVFIGSVSCKGVGFAVNNNRIMFTDRRQGRECVLLDSISLTYKQESNVFSMKISEETTLSQELCHTHLHSDNLHFYPINRNSNPIRLPSLNISEDAVVTVGCSHAGDFAMQFHVAFSSLVSGSCVFSGQPFHCAVEKFARDYLVPQNNSTGVPNCDGCPSGYTLLYDHCKNHPQYVDVGQLVDYPRRACGQNPIIKSECIDDPKYLYEARAYVFHPTHDRCYLPGSVENTADLYAMLITDPSSHLKFVDDQPFPHTLPKNSTPYFNHTEPAGFDGPGECLRWVYNESFGYEPLRWATDPKQENFFVFDQSEFVDDWGVGMKKTGLIYIPTRCLPPELNNGTISTTQCKLIFMLGVDVDFARYSENNDIVIVGMQLGELQRISFMSISRCQSALNVIDLDLTPALKHIGGHVDQSRFPNACEVLRGLSDVYGQLSDDYAMQSGYQMRVGGRILKRILGIGV